MGSPLFATAVTLELLRQSTEEVITEYAQQPTDVHINSSFI